MARVCYYPHDDRFAMQTRDLDGKLHLPRKSNYPAASEAARSTTLHGDWLLI
ncbi:MAG: hypothetical protein ACJ8BW_34455 [Ktedonobacteraceae bacterium]